nr:MAG TPA: helix-turn-helix domain protein [Caudoviricetes sp.]
MKDLEIGKRIQYTLAKNDIKPYKMAEEIGISQGNLYDILNGKNSNPTIKVVKKIADYLGVTVDELLK